jgi:hypothetical protein
MKAQFRSSISPRKRKLVLWTLGLLLFYTIVGFLILPPIIRAVAVKQLSKQLDREVSIRQVKLNPFALSATVRGLLIKDKDGEPFVSWDEVYVNFQLSSFFGRPWVFKEISTTRPFVRAQMNKDGSFNFSDLAAKFSTNAAPAKTESKPLALDWPAGHHAGQFPHRSGQQKSLRLHRHHGRGRGDFVERLFLSLTAAFAGRLAAVPFRPEQIRAAVSGFGALRDSRRLHCPGRELPV